MSTIFRRWAALWATLDDDDDELDDDGVAASVNVKSDFSLDLRSIVWPAAGDWEVTKSAWVEVGLSGQQLAQFGKKKFPFDQVRPCISVGVPHAAKVRHGPH